MKPRPVDECLVASIDLIATTRSKLAQLQFSVDTCLNSIEISADAIAASQALLAKLDGGAQIEQPPASEQTSASDGAAELHRREAAPGTAG